MDIISTSIHFLCDCITFKYVKSNISSKGNTQRSRRLSFCSHILVIYEAREAQAEHLADTLQVRHWVTTCFKADK